MNDDRRYPDDDVREIFEMAAAAQSPARRSLGSSDGLTLVQLQEIGREAGLDPARIAEAASALEVRRGALPRRTMLGMTTGVGRVVTLPRAPTDGEWERLLADLRQTFEARGRVHHEGGLRQWSNGNLRVAIEPGQAGYRLRMQTVNGQALAFNRIGLAALLMALVLVLVAVAGGDAGTISGALALGLMGGGTLAANALRLSRWASEREQQMEELATHSRALIGAGATASEADEAER